MMAGREESPSGELRAGSSAAVIRLSTDLYQIMARVISATPTTPEDHIAQLVAAEVVTRAGRFLDGTTANLEWRDFTSLMANVSRADQRTTALRCVKDVR